MHHVLFTTRQKWRGVGGSWGECVVGFLTSWTNIRAPQTCGMSAQLQTRPKFGLEFLQNGQVCGGAVHLR
jgi:hypothetical protein